MNWRHGNVMEELQGQNPVSLFAVNARMWAHLACEYDAKIAELAATRMLIHWIVDRIQTCSLRSLPVGHLTYSVPMKEYW